MSLDHVVDAIIDEDSVLQLRAIRLYELQVAILSRGSFGALCNATHQKHGATKRLRTARILAAIRFLERAEADLRRTNSIDAIPLQTLAQDHTHQIIFDEFIAPNGGWEGIRRSNSDRAFDKGLTKRRDAATYAAKIVDFSFRFELMPNPGRYRGGVTVARKVVIDAPSYDVKLGRTRISEHSRDFADAAPFLYLLLKQAFPFTPPPLASEDFIEKLSEQANNVQGLRMFFCAYQRVSEVLKLQGYQPVPLTLNLECDVPPLPIEPYAEDVIRAFEQSKGVSD